MHVLIVPSDTYVSKECPIGGIFQQHQARALRGAGHKVGVISIQLLSFELIREILFARRQGVELDSDQGIPVIRRHGRYWIPPLPRRFCHSVLRSLAKGLRAVGFSHHIVRGEVRLVLRAAMALFQEYVREHGMPDLVHAHNALFAGVLGSRIRTKFGIPYVITEHSSAYARGLISECQIQYIREAFLNADRRLVVSSCLGRLLERFLGNDVRPWTCVPNILDETFAKEVLIQKPEQHGKNPFRFLTIGRLFEGKGIRGLLNAFASKFRGENAVQLKVGGEGPLRKQLQRQANRLGIDNQVSFLGELAREQVLLEMQSCHTFVLPSHYETFGVVLIEALSCGKPVISTKCGGPEEIVNPQNGMLVRNKNIPALGEAMEAMRMNIDRYDNAWIQKDCTSRFGQSAVVGKLSDIYTEVCQQR